MFEHINRSRNCGLFCFLWIVLSISFLHAQEQKAIPEKVYLHTDRTIYFIDEDLWYKAYNVNAYNNSLYDNSNILYVELVAPDSKIVARNKTNLEVGLGNGDFRLKDSLGVKPGHYQLRAYTNWNRNFGEDFVFKKDIEIINVFEENARLNKAKKSQNTDAIVKALTTGVQNTTKVDFFPEGGSLLENVASVVGFKAVDVNGNPIEVKGDVFDSNNELVTSFASPHDGMGKFQFIPTEGKDYYAKVKTATGAEFRVAIPKAAKNGYLLSFRVFKGKNIITINTNPATLLQSPNKTLSVVCKAKGVSYLETTHLLTETSFSFELPKDKAPDGISQITLFDSNSKPQSERLVYIENEQDLEVQLTTDKSSYTPAEKTTINVTSKSKTGVAKSASFSVSVTDMNGEIEDKDFGTNICSYYLMESDIRGKVHNPAYYFDPSNLKRLEHLDNLLLTQGWRDFLWKTTLQLKNSTNFIAEKGISISGNVKQLFGEKPLIDTKMTLALMNNKHFNVFYANTDIAGRFKFENLMFSGKTTMFLNTRNGKGKFRGEIVMDLIENPSLPVSFKMEQFDLSETTRRITKNVFNKYVAFGVDPENILEEVTITSKSKSNGVGNYGNYGFADNTYVADADAATFTSIYELIGQKVPGVDVFGTSIRFMRFEKEPLIIIDGILDTTGLIANIQPSDVTRIDAVKGSQATLFWGADDSMPGPNGLNGILAIYTNGNTGNQIKKQGTSSINQKIEGFQTARIFYSPNPEKPNAELDNKLDVRNTLYWNPFVHPDKTGNTSVSYYNSIVETKVKVALEGITGTGIPVVKKTYYNIKK